jgi:uncharacterized coiled-coil protein SlyX
MASTQELINQIADERIAALELRVGELETTAAELAAALYETACDGLNRDTTQVMMLEALKRAVGNPPDIQEHFDAVCERHTQLLQQIKLGRPFLIDEGVEEYADPLGPEG